MTRKLLEYAIESGSSITIAYSKDGEKTNRFLLNNISYHPQYGNNYIVGYCKDFDSELTFKVDKIIDADIEWVDVFPHNSCVEQEGLYLVTCRSDMHLEFDLRKYRKGDNLLDIYTNENGIESCYSQENVLAYHYIPYYTQEDRNWIHFEKNDEEREGGFYTFAYLLTGDDLTQEEKEYDWVDDYDNWVQMKDFVSPWELTNTKANGINYTVNCLGIPFDKLRIPSNIKVLAYHYCSFYTEDDHANHWDLAEKLGLIK